MSEVNPVSSADATTYPLYPSAIILPALAFPAIFLDIPPLLWHIKQRNIAAWSMIAWVIISNIFLSVNPLIWPRDNVYEWWDGAVFCDIQARITVGGMVGLPCAVTCIIRKLANIMDTRHITMAPRPARKSKENFLEVLWCWGFPAFIIVVYYIVQPIRYFIVGISGCVAAFDASWPSIIVVWVWQPIIMLFAGYYSCKTSRIFQFTDLNAYKIRSSPLAPLPLSSRIRSHDFRKRHHKVSIRTTCDYEPDSRRFHATVRHVDILQRSEKYQRAIRMGNRPRAKLELYHQSPISWYRLVG